MWHNFLCPKSENFFDRENNWSKLLLLYANDLRSFFFLIFLTIKTLSFFTSGADSNDLYIWTKVYLRRVFNSKEQDFTRFYNKY